MKYGIPGLYIPKIIGFKWDCTHITQLQKHFLGYQDYRPINKPRELTPITPELISQIVDLRRQYILIKDISKKVGLSEAKTEEIL